MFSYPSILSSCMSKRRINFKFDGEVRQPHEILADVSFMPLVVITALGMAQDVLRLDLGFRVEETSGPSILGLRAVLPAYVEGDRFSIVCLAFLESAAEKIFGLAPNAEGVDVDVTNVYRQYRALQDSSAPDGDLHG
jgi:branched-subunit amino acid transport protein